jgi:hypothetical protein
MRTIPPSLRIVILVVVATAAVISSALAGSSRFWTIAAVSVLGLTLAVGLVWSVWDLLARLRREGERKENPVEVGTEQGEDTRRSHSGARRFIVALAAAAAIGIPIALRDDSGSSGSSAGEPTQEQLQRTMEKLNASREACRTQHLSQKECVQRTVQSQIGRPGQPPR